MRKKFVELSKKELINNPGSYVLLGDIGVGGFVLQDESLPDRVINMGIAEQSLVGFAAGLADKKANIIVHTISPFLVERAYEQIKLNCGYNQKKLILISANGPFDYEKLGPTHHCPADINLLSMIPYLELRTPSTIEEFESSFNDACNSNLSFYIRVTSRYAHSINYTELEDGWKLLKNKSNLKVNKAYLTTGESLKYLLDNNLNINADIYFTSNPKSVIPNIINKYSKVYSVEPYLRSEFVRSESVTAQIASILFDNKPKKIIKENLGWEDFDHE